MNKDLMHGWTKQITGTLRAHFGRAIGNRAVTLKGRVGQVIGKTQASYGSARARLKTRSEQPCHSCLRRHDRFQVAAFA